MKAGTHNAYEDALLQYSGLNEEEGDAFQYSSSPSNGGMRGGFGAGANPGANLPAAAAGPPGGFNHQNKMAFAPPNRGAPLKFAPPKFATAHDLPRRGGGHAESNSVCLRPVWHLSPQPFQQQHADADWPVLFAG